MRVIAQNHLIFDNIRKEYFSLRDWPTLDDEYEYILVTKPNLGNIQVICTNELEIVHRNNITYGTWYTTHAKNCVAYTYDKDTGVFLSPEILENDWVAGNNPYWDYTTTACWANKDIYCKNSDGTEYVAVPGSSLRSLVIEYGWSDGGKDDVISDITTPDFVKGWSAAGSWRCVVKEASVGDVVFQWLDNGSTTQEVKSYTGTGDIHSDYKPSLDKIGSYGVYCKVIDSSGNECRTDVLYWNVIGDTSLVTDIVLSASPDTVTPGEHSSIFVKVKGIGYYLPAWNVQIDGHNSQKTNIAREGNFCNVWVSEDETAEYITVTATSVQDQTITASAIININHSTTEPGNGTDSEPGIEDEQIRLAFLKGYAAARALFGGGG